MMNIKDRKFHDRRKEWLDEIVKMVYKHGDKAEIEIDGNSFILKVTCGHETELDGIQK